MEAQYKDKIPSPLFWSNNLPVLLASHQQAICKQVITKWDCMQESTMNSEWLRVQHEELSHNIRQGQI